MLQKKSIFLPVMALMIAQPVAAETVAPTNDKEPVTFSFYELDADGNGMVSREEFAALSGASDPDVEFNLIDTDQDNYLTKEEVDVYNQSQTTGYPPAHTPDAPSDDVLEEPSSEADAMDM